MPYPFDPEPAATSYGSVERVTDLAKTWTNYGGIFRDADEAYEIKATNPSLTAVVAFIDQYSSLLNMALRIYGIETPLKTTDARASAAGLIEGVVSDLVAYINSKGRFFTDGFKKTGLTVWEAVRNDVIDFAQQFAPGMEAGGETRIDSNVYKVSTRGRDAAGEEIFPIFQRKGFGNRFDDWTKP